MKTRMAVLISGNGSNLQALLDATKSEDFPAEIVLVISNNADAYGVTRADSAGVPVVVVSHKDYATREAFDARMHQELLAHDVALVCMAGFMRLLSAEFVQHWQGRLLNIHPSLLPEFKGLDAIGQALRAGVKTTGCTVHYVSEAMDEGEVIVQERVDIAPEDTLETLAHRVHEAEHRIYPQAVKRVILNKR